MAKQFRIKAKTASTLSLTSDEYLFQRKHWYGWKTVRREFMFLCSEQKAKQILETLRRLENL